MLKRSEEVCRGISLRHKGKPISEETKLKMSESHKKNPRVWTEEQRRRVSEKVRAIWASRRGTKGDS